MQIILQKGHLRPWIHHMVVMTKASAARLPGFKSWICAY